jgi:hypothetical protein
MTSLVPSPAFINELRAVLRENYADLLEYVSHPAFLALLDEMYALAPEARPDFVRAVVLKMAELQRREIVVRHDILIQRSAFGDRRPTLFCVRKLIPPPFSKYWRNVNLTFDNQYRDEDIPRDAQAWRVPLSFDDQADLIAGRTKRGWD